MKANQLIVGTAIVVGLICGAVAQAQGLGGVGPASGWCIHW